MNVFTIGVRYYLRLIFAVTSVAMASSTSSAFDNGSSPKRNFSSSQLLKVLHKVRTEYEWPGIELSTAAKTLRTREGTLRFVTDDITYVGYQGSYGRASGTLRTRTGNSTDKAILLADLLKRKGYEVRLVRADWPVGIRPFRTENNKRKIPSLRQLSEMVRPFAGEVKFGDRKVLFHHARGAIKQVNREVRTASKVVEKVLKDNNLLSTFYSADSVAKMVESFSEEDWVWVQARKKGDKWIDMDPTFPRKKRPKRRIVDYKPKPATVELTLKLVNSGKSVNLIEWKGPVEKILGYDIVISFLPEDKRFKSPYDITDPNQVRSWKPQLQIGENKLAGKLFTADDVRVKNNGGSRLEGESYLLVEIQNITYQKSARIQRYFSRVIQDFSKGFDAHELVSLYRIGYHVSAIPQSVIQSRMVDELIDLIGMRVAVDGVKPPEKLSYQRGVSPRTVRIINTLSLNMVDLADSQFEIGWIGPTVFIDSARLVREKDQVFCERQIDFLSQSFSPAKGSSRSDRIAWGLVINATEAALVRSRSVSQHLIKAADKLVVIRKSDVKGKLGPDDPDVRKQILYSDGVVIQAKDDSSKAWAISRTGDLFAVLTQKDLRRQAKGSNGRSPIAGQIFGGFGVATLGYMGVPMAPLVGGLVYYFSNLADAYNGAAVKINRIADLIGGGAPSAPARPNGANFSYLARRILSSLGNGVSQDFYENLANTPTSQVFLAFRDSAGNGREIFDAGTALGMGSFPSTPLVSRQTIDGVVRYATRGLK